MTKFGIQVQLILANIVILLGINTKTSNKEQNCKIKKDRKEIFWDEKCNLLKSV